MAQRKAQRSTKTKRRVEAKRGGRQRAKRPAEILDYDSTDVCDAIDVRKPLHFETIGLRLPEAPPTQVISIRLPTELVNELRALGSDRDVSYQALIKLYLADSVQRAKKAS